MMVVYYITFTLRKYKTPVLIGQILTVNQKSTSDVKLLLYDIKILCMKCNKEKTLKYFLSVAFIASS